MRHFAQELVQSGFRVIYSKLDDFDNTGSLNGEVEKVINKYKIEHLVMTHPSEYRILKDALSWESSHNISVEIRQDNRFLCKIEEFYEWAKSRKQLRMEYFYRILMIFSSFVLQNTYQNHLKIDSGSLWRRFGIDLVLQGRIWVDSGWFGLDFS